MNLQKRGDTAGDVGAPVEVASSKASPFGAARPADTAARDKAVADKLEEKKQEALKERKAADEKKAADDKAVQEKRMTDRAAARDKEQSGVNGNPGSQQKREVLRKDSSKQTTQSPTDPMARTEQASTTVNGTATRSPAAAAPSQSDSTKPQEIVRDIQPKSGSNASDTNNTSSAGGEDAKATNGDAQAAADGADTTETLDEEGWSTVSKPNKTGKRGSRAPALAKPIAS